MAREARLIGTATDANNIIFDVRERRATNHGFLLHIGWPKGEPRGRGCGGPKVILTVELAQYLTATRSRDVDLPIGGTTVKVLRNAIGLRWSWDEWWAARSDDLLSLTLEGFSNKHGCSTGAASQRRTTLKGLVSME